MFAAPIPFAPHAALRCGHAQTVAGAALACRAPLLAQRRDFARIAIPVGAGDQLEGWFKRGQTGEAVLLSHGLGGSVDSPYLRRTVDELARDGHSVLAVAQRGAGGDVERSTRPYMTGNTADLICALEWLRSEVGDERIGAVGFSISGNTLLKHLGKAASADASPDALRQSQSQSQSRRQSRPGALPGALPDYGIAIAPPIDLDEASRDLNRMRSRAYELWILRACRRWIPRLRGDYTGPIRVPAWSSFRAFDERYITPVWGFKSLDEYYDTASSRTLLARITTPTLVLQAADDPVVDPRHIMSAELGPGVRLDVQQSGGHLGYVANKAHGSRRRRWLAKAIAHHVRGLPARSKSKERDHACAAR